MNHDWKKVSGLLAAAVAAMSLAGLASESPTLWQGDAFAQDGPADTARAGDQGQSNRTPLVNQQNLAHAESLSAAFRAVATAVRPCVVSISTRTEIAAPRGPRNVPPGFEEFFGGRPQSREASGMGSGVIVRPDGYILTNNHVVENANELTVELFDGRTIAGEIVGTDPQTDLAVVKIDLPGLKAANFGSADDIRVGDWVVAIGSPFGLDQTVTAGIISGKNRVQRIIDGGDGFEDFLQTDAAINPGNSGGPLVNLRGELIGINTAILSRSGASAGIGFAIPESLAQPVLRSIIETGEVKRGFLGASVVAVTPESVRKYDLAARSGALIQSVLADRPAAQAGLQPGDVVTSLDGRKVISSTQLRNYVASRPPGTTIVMDVDRNGQPLKVRVSLQERTDAAMAMFDEQGGLFGAAMTPVTPETARKFGYRGLQNGLIVTGIEDDSAAADARLQVGDVIETAAGIPLTSVDQLAEIFAAAKKRGLPLRCVVRRGDSVNLLMIR